MKRKPDKVSECVVSGISTRIEYWNKSKKFSVEPDSDDIASASILDLLRYWVIIGNWAKRFQEANQGWHQKNAHFNVEVRASSNSNARESDESDGW